jgi:hypothetical protein
MEVPEPVGRLKYRKDLVITSGMEAILVRDGAFYGPG